MRESAYSKNIRRLLVMLSAFAVSHAAGTAMAGDTAEASFVKDLDVRQRPMADIVPTSAAKPAAKSKLSVSVALDRPNRAYKKGDSVVLKVKATEDAFIWIFDTGTSGKVHQIYPNRFEKNNFLTGGKTLTIPPANAKYAVTANHPKGTELVTVIASRDEIPLTAALLDQSGGGGPFRVLRGTASSVSKDLSVTLRKKETPWAADQVGFRIK